MKKVYFNLLAILGSLSLLVGATYAYFSSNAVTMTGITLATAGPLLQISPSGSGWGLTMVGSSESNIYPGWIGAERSFWLKNNSGNGAPIAKVIPTISTQAGDWEILKGLILACFYEKSGGSCDNWQTLNFWSTNTSTSILATTLNDLTTREMVIKYKMDTSATDSAKDKSITGLEWSLVGRTN